MAILSSFRSRTPHARFDENRFVTFFDLDLGELMAFGVLVLFMPLISFGLHLPFFLWLLTMVSFPSWALFLYFVKHDQRNAAYWMAKMVPFWLRQRRFLQTNRQAQLTAAHELIDRVAFGGVNALSFEWREGADGTPELHVFEEPLRPYRAWISSAGEPSRGSLMELPS